MKTTLTPKQNNQLGNALISTCFAFLLYFLSALALDVLLPGLFIYYARQEAISRWTYMSADNQTTLFYVYAML